jgi:hypothetical protein
MLLLTSDGEKSDAFVVNKVFVYYSSCVHIKVKQAHMVSSVFANKVFRISYR